MKQNIPKSLYSETANFSKLAELIAELEHDSRYLLVAFLLRAQLVEFALKHALTNAAYKPDDFDATKAENSTMGQVIHKLEQLNDSYYDEIIAAAKKFLPLRNELVHHFLTSKYTEKELRDEIREKLEIASDLERMILRYFEWVKEVHDLPHYP